MDTRTRGLSAALLLTVLGSLAAPSTTAAQGWMSDRSRREGPGFRLGDFELHPGVGVEVGWDSNVYYHPDGDPLMVDSGILRATAHLDVSSRGQQRQEEGASGGTSQAPDAVNQPTATFRAGVAGAFYAFFAAPDRTNMEVDANVGVVILPGRTFSLEISDDFGRSVRPFSQDSTRIASYARINNNAGIAANLATSGDVLRFTLGYNNELTFFEDDDFYYANNFQHHIRFEERFRFLPQTAIVHSTRLTFVDYFDDPRSGPTLQNDSFQLTTRVGVNGALTQSFSFTVLAGYGAGFYDNSAGTSTSYDVNYESVVIQAGARWKIEENISLRFGYDRDFQPSYVGNFYRRDRGSIAYQMLIDGAFLLGADFEFGFYEFGAIVGPDGVTAAGTTLTREDWRIVGSLFAEYRFTNWLGINATARYTGNITDYQYIIPMATPEPASFNKFEVWGGVRVFY